MYSCLQLLAKLLTLAVGWVGLGERRTLAPNKEQNAFQKWEKKLKTLVGHHIPGKAMKTENKKKHNHVFSDELSVKIGKPQEPLHLLVGGGNRPISSSTDLRGDHLDVVGGHNKTQEGDSDGVEITSPLSQKASGGGAAVRPGEHVGYWLSSSLRR